MKLLEQSNSTKRRFTKRTESGFTFTEMLAAMVFMALVIPAALQGVRLASDVGTLAQRKTEAAQIGESLLNELVVTDEWRGGLTSGRFDPPLDDYEWKVETYAWEEAGMTQLNLFIVFPLRGNEYQIVLSTLVTEEQEVDDATSALTL